MDHSQACWKHDTVAEFSPGTTRQALTPHKERPPDIPAVPSRELPLIVRQPCWVQFLDNYYEADRQGLYRFWNWGKVYYEHPDAIPQVAAPSDGYLPTDHCYDGFIRFDDDILALLGSISILHLHGHHHDRLSYQQKLQRLREGSLSLTCGDIAALVMQLLGDLGFRARRLYTLRLEGTWNTYDNGHILLEFFWNEYNKWVAVDIDLHCMFTRHGAFLNFSDLHSLTMQGKSYELTPLTAADELLLDASDSILSTFPGMRLFEPVFLDVCRQKQWYNTVFAAGGFQVDDTMVWASQHPDAARLNRSSSVDTILKWSDFVHRFYEYA